MTWRTTGAVLLAVSLGVTVTALVFEGQTNNIYTDCLQRAGESLRRYRNQRASDETLEWSCIQSYLWQTAAEREAPRNLTRRQINFLTTLIGEPRSTRAWRILTAGSSFTTRRTRPPFRSRTTERPVFTFFTPQTTRRPQTTGDFFTFFTPQTTRRPQTTRDFFTFFTPETTPPRQTRRTTRQTKRTTRQTRTTRPTRPPTRQTRPPTRQTRPPTRQTRPPTRQTRPPTRQTRPPTRQTRPPTRQTRPPTRSTRRPPFTFPPFGQFPFGRFQGNSNSNRRVKRSAHRRLKRALAGIPRKEYRAMTDAERNALHAALNLAKEDTSLTPNVYDFMASLHTGVLASGAHGGPAFLGFHRIYLLLMDLVVCYFDATSTVRMPFWDNTLDNEMTNPAASIMWHSTFAGKGNGFVDNGPFGSWSTINGPPIRRSIGSGNLMSQAEVDAVLTRSFLTQISRPTADPPYNLEGHHGRVHGWVGGDMGSLNTATNDPVFFMHHAFIDCVWERFRDRQWSLGIDPSTDYPGTFQAFNRPTDSIGILPSITNYQAVSNVYASLATCVWPECPSCGSSGYLRCVRNRCVPIISDEAELCPACPGNSPGGYNGYQNSYCVNRNCDTDQWAYLPVQITYNRPPDYDTRGAYRSYPVRSGRPQTQYDIYSPRGYTGPYRRTYNGQDRSPRYTECGCREGGAGSGAVYLQSYGINYDGYYRESSVVDRRYALSSNTGYVAVRRPSFRAAQSYVSVYDDCGRLCRPTCWDSRSSRWVACSGAVTVTSGGGQRRGYGNTYEEATYEVWDYGPGQRYEYPTYRPGNVYLNYVCDYSGTFPWQDYRG